MHDELYSEIKGFIKHKKKVSCRGLEKKFGIGYIRAARVLSQLEEAGLVSEAKPARARKVLNSSSL